jgi:hypothetical protein
LKILPSSEKERKENFKVMGIRDWFHKQGQDEVTGTKVLVCALDARFNELVETDGQIYRQYYPATTTIVFSDTQELTEALKRPFDIVHLLCDALSDGIVKDINGNEISGIELIQKCCENDVKLLWLASDNPPDVYIQGFKARGKRVNLVMTINRNGSKFSDFLDKILFRMFYGDTMPIAWVDLCPQIPGSSHLDSPECLFYAGRGRVKLR